MAESPSYGCRSRCSAGSTSGSRNSGGASVGGGAGALGVTGGLREACFAFDDFALAAIMRREKSRFNEPTASKLRLLFWKALLLRTSRRDTNGWVRSLLATDDAPGHDIQFRPDATQSAAEIYY